MALALVWGSSFLVLRVLVTAGMGPTGVGAARTLLGVGTLLPFAWMARRTFPRSGRTWLALAVLGLTNFATPWTLFAIGQKYVTSGVGSITNSAQPLWAVLLTTLFLRQDSLSRAKLAGLALGFCGVLVLMNDGLRSLDGESLKGIPLMILATVFYAASSVSIRRSLLHVPVLPLTVTQLGFAAIYLLPLALITGAYRDVSMGWQEWCSLIILGGLGSGAAILVFMWLVVTAGAVRASIVTYLMPPIGVFLGWLILDEAIGWNMIAGLALIVAGVAIVQGVPVARLLGRGRTVGAPLPDDGAA